MGYWKRLIKIAGGTDYYCINNMTCLIHVSYCVVVLVTVPVILSTIMLPVDFATLPDACYTSCGDTLFMYTYTLHCMCLVPVYHIDTIPVYSHRYLHTSSTCSHASRQQCLLYTNMSLL